MLLELLGEPLELAEAALDLPGEAVGHDADVEQREGRAALVRARAVVVSMPQSMRTGRHSLMHDEFVTTAILSFTMTNRTTTHHAGAHPA